MENGFVRKPSGLEAFFVDLDAGGCNMTIHFYLQLDRKPDVDRLRKTMQQILSTHFGADMRFYKNAWYTSSYTHNCPVIEVEDYDLSSYTPPKLDFRQSTVDIKVLHATLSDTWYIGFDFFHGVMDGRSIIQFVYDFFDFLNNRKHPEPEFTLNAYEVLNDDGAANKDKIRDAFTIFPQCVPYHWEIKKEGEDRNVIICHQGTIRATSARFATVVSKLFNKKSAKMIIPVDIRCHAEQNNKNLYGNLFVPMFVDTANYPEWTETQDEIVHFAKHKSHIRSMAKKLNIYRKIPTKFRQFVIRHAIPLVMSRKKFIDCARVSSLGSIDSKRLCCEDLAVRDCFVSFVSFPFAAFSVISLQYEGHTNTSIAWHSGRVPEKTVNTLVSGINDCMHKEALKPST